MEKENHCETFTFQLKLLLDVEEMKKYPFTKLIIEKNVTEKEYQHTLCLLKELNHRYEEDMESGLIDHSSLLLHFAGMLCYKLPINETLCALHQEGFYLELTEQLISYSHR
ncbi:Protein of unknown function [Halobacillus karajensis]|uniref:DUF1878 domain-containing protein n=1 Tax=Halobacillus karajensis TaxID=195088 RepID=A0A059NWB8_9BACI|nr:DUF1878 family protein [Halobacillus karajensis]CDQ21112.1 hypothetical protein BN982_03475 [Halobacillus karajensis]CDQ24824.1 hypothetical protein BN983_03123 [Halobacillus karajensis]CDQ28816.1 hypothetical protein BN981_03131 [Halobacillus karajensis]SEH96085.1 Protein of unknown function [Halobacillus karajensis]